MTSPLNKLQEIGNSITTLNNTCAEVNLSAADKRLCCTNSGATAFVYIDDVQNPTRLMNLDDSTYTAASTSSNAIRFSSNDVFGQTTTISGSGRVCTFVKKLHTICALYIQKAKNYKLISHKSLQHINLLLSVSLCAAGFFFLKNRDKNVKKCNILIREVE